MKKFKIAFPFLAIVLAIAASAFTAQPPASAFSEAWFVYDGVGLKTDADSYTFYHQSSNPGCSGSNALCAVRAEIANPGDNQQDWIPDESSLQQLAQSSNDFQMQTTEVRLFP